MANPGGNYPGRQIWLGSLDGKPAFAYLVTGRSDASKSRYATPYLEDQNTIRMERVDSKEPFDIFRHYQAVRIDPKTGLLLVSNNQACVDPVFESYLCNGIRQETPAIRTEKILAAIGPEYDSKEKPTSRVIGVIMPENDDSEALLGITTQEDSSHIFPFYPTIGTGFAFVQTYDGNVDYKNFGPEFPWSSTFDMPQVTSAGELALELYEMSDYIDIKYGDLRVCAVAGVRNGNGPGGWEIARKNRFSPQ